MDLRESELERSAVWLDQRAAALDLRAVELDMRDGESKNRAANMDQRASGLNTRAAALWQLESEAAELDRRARERTAELLLREKELETQMAGGQETKVGNIVVGIMLHESELDQCRMAMVECPHLVVAIEHKFDRFSYMHSFGMCIEHLFKCLSCNWLNQTASD